MITILAYYERISVFHTILPFLLKNHESGKKIFQFTQSVDWCLAKDKNKILFMERFFQHREPRDLENTELEILKKLRDKYKTIVFFCGQPEAGTNRLDILPLVDRLFYKSVFANRNEYQKSLYGKNLFADYYHKNFDVTDKPEYINRNLITEKETKKPELSWNIGLGTYPRWTWPQRLGGMLARADMPVMGQFLGGKSIRYANKPGTGKNKIRDFSGSKRGIDVHARIDPVTCPSIAFQRVLMVKKISELPDDKKKMFVTGTVRQKQYYRELTDSKIVLSPFGWGEVCFRDFEAILSGALMFKPDMSHLLTWPNVYIPHETYVPLKWDGSDFAEKSEQYMNNEKERTRIAHNAFEQYKNELAGLSKRVDELIGEYY